MSNKKQVITEDSKDAIGTLVGKIVIDKFEDCVISFLESRDLSIALAELLQRYLGNNNKFTEQAVIVVCQLKRICILLNELQDNLEELHGLCLDFGDEYSKR